MSGIETLKSGNMPARPMQNLSRGRRRLRSPRPCDEDDGHATWQGDRQSVTEPASPHVSEQVGSAHIYAKTAQFHAGGVARSVASTLLGLVIRGRAGSAHQGRRRPEASGGPGGTSTDIRRKNRTHAPTSAPRAPHNKQANQTPWLTCRFSLVGDDGFEPPPLCL